MALAEQAPVATPVADPIISVQGVTKRFGSHTVLSGVTFDVPRGKTSAVLGPSGTGKSVLLKVIIGLLRPEEGQILIEGEPMVGVSEKEVLRIRRKIGVLFQDGALFGSMNLFDNIAFPLVKHTDKSDDEIHEIVMAKSDLVGLNAHLKKLPGEVSGGMRKRAGLARALALEPHILFFDEPDSGLDPVRVAYLDDLVNTVQEETGATFFVITHNIESVRRTADYFGVLFRSKLVAFGSKEYLSQARIPIVDQFLAGRTEGPISMDEMADAEVVPSAPTDNGTSAATGLTTTGPSTSSSSTSSPSTSSPSTSSPSTSSPSTSSPSTSSPSTSSPSTTHPGNGAGPATGQPVPPNGVARRPQPGVERSTAPANGTADVHQADPGD